MVDTLLLLKKGPTTEEPDASTTPQPEQQPASSDIPQRVANPSLRRWSLQLGVLEDRDQQEHDVALGVLSRAGHSVACHFLGSHVTVPKMGR